MSNHLDWHWNKRLLIQGYTNFNGQSIEGLYQAFKERFIMEMEAERQKEGNSNITDMPNFPT